MKYIKNTAAYLAAAALILLTFPSCNHSISGVSDNESESSMEETSSTGSAEDMIPADSTAAAPETTAAAPESAAGSPTASRVTKAAAASPASTNASASTVSTAASPTQFPNKQSDLPPIAASIDKSKLYYRQFLTSDEQPLYDFLLYYAERHDSRMLYAPNFTLDQVTEAQEFMYRDNPQLFWDNDTLPSVPSGYSVDDHVFQLNFAYNRDQVISRQKEIDSKTKTILAGIHTGQSQFDTELYLRDCLMNDSTWDGKKEVCSNIVDALIYKDSASFGYAKAMQYLLLKAGIPCIFFTGTTCGGSYHAWNIVYIDNAYYQLDVYDPDSSDSPYYYFNVTTQTVLNKGRKIITEASYRKFTLPTCTATADNYYIKKRIAN